jgi:hypothetical protein
MSAAFSAEPGSEMFREDDEKLSVALTFGPVAGASPRWSLMRPDGERIVLDAVRPSRHHVRSWLTPFLGEARALALVARVGRLQHFYAEYYALRPDLAQGHLVAVA